MKVVNIDGIDMKEQIYKMIETYNGMIDYAEYLDKFFKDIKFIKIDDKRNIIDLINKNMTKLNENLDKIAEIMDITLCYQKDMLKINEILENNIGMKLKN